ncbi:MAG: glucosaminidase domain-containing protein [Bacteroidota bacterium]
MKKIFLFFLLLVYTANLKAQSTADYIVEHAALAQSLMREHLLPASVILGIAIHESAAGKSKIAQYLNNQFGIKGPNSNTEIHSAYRDYPTIDSSYNHFVSFLHSRTYFDSLFDKYNQYDYKNWVLGIQRGGYARSRTWASQVIAIIKKYELYQYDERPEDYIEPSIPIKKPGVKKTKIILPSKSKVYTVRSGDNLNQIAERNGTTSTALMRKNGLKSSILQPGQKIKL